jgi:hypothetical protein
MLKETIVAYFKLRDEGFNVHISYISCIIITTIIVIIIIIISRKINILIYDYKTYLSSITRTDCVKDLGILLVSKLHFHNHVSHTFLIVLSRYMYVCVYILSRRIIA